MTFRYKAKSIFLTYAQCPLPKETVLEVLHKRTGSRKDCTLLKAAIGQEKHQDGNHHLHICAWYTHELAFTDAKYLDIEGYHPNIRDNRIKRKEKALNYVAKEDPEPLQYNMDIKEETKARESKKKILGKRILDGEPLTTLVDENPELLWDVNKLHIALTTYKRLKKEEKPDLPDHIPNSFNIMLPWIPEEKK